MNQNPWHYQRLELAEQTLQILTSGVTQAVTLFAPRRTGKTEFLTHDLMPIAQQQEHPVVYASFWQAPVSPLAVLLHELETSLSTGSLLERMGAYARKLKPKLKLSSPDGTAVAEVDLTTLSGAPPAELLLHLDTLLDRLSKKQKKPALLLLDEVQVLAQDESSASLIAALRTSLDKRPNALKVLFTGSSQVGLQAMFGAREAPFFHFGTRLPFPELGEEFIEHQLTTFQLTASRKLDRTEVTQAFEALHNNPYYFRRLIEMLLLDRNLSVEKAAIEVKVRVADELGYGAIWLGLTEIQRATATVLARSTEKPFSKAARKEIGEIIGGKMPSSAKVQAALRRLDREGLVVSLDGVWQLADLELADWIRNQSVVE